MQNQNLTCPLDKWSAKFFSYLEIGPGDISTYSVQVIKRAGPCFGFNVWIWDLGFPAQLTKWPLHTDTDSATDSNFCFLFFFLSVFKSFSEKECKL